MSKMDVHAAFLIFMVTSTLSICYCDNTNSNHGNIKTPGSYGGEVVEAAVERIQALCIFPDDKLFLRRLAYVESNDGKHPDTYRDGYHGGIWQMDEDMFNETKTSDFYQKMENSYLTPILQHLGFDWKNVKWEDLRTPMVSGVGARLYIQYKSNPSPDSDVIPRDLKDQGDFYVQYYRPKSTAETFVDAANLLEEGCKYNRADVVFVLDESGSISSSNFNLMKDFVRDVINSFTISKDETQIGLITYSSDVTTEWTLNDYHDKTDMLNALDKVSYNGGGTYTYKALDHLCNNMFLTDNNYGGRGTGNPSVGIVVTDGHSSGDLVTATEGCHNKDVIMLAVGVANYDINELELIASVPKCTNVFELANFDEFEALKDAIQKAACDAPVILKPSEDNENTTIPLPPDSGVNCQIECADDGTTVKIDAKTGSAVFYVADDSYPSEAYYDAKTEAVPGDIGVLYVPCPVAKVVFCHLKGDEKNDSTVVVDTEKGDTDWCKSSGCQNGASCKDYGDGYNCICTEDFKGEYCEQPKAYDCINTDPCEGQEGGYYPHVDDTKFVQCSHGTCHVMPCAPGTVWDQDILACNWP